VTQKQAAQLTRWQAGKLNSKSFNLLAQKRISPKLLQAIFSSNDEVMLTNAIRHLQNEVTALKANKTVESEKKLNKMFGLFKTLLNERVTPLEEVRSTLVSAIREIAATWDKRVIPILLDGLKDSSKAIRAWSADGLGLIILVNSSTSKEVITGLKKMAEEGNPLAKEIYKKVTRTGFL
jgi:HEAT repeat protein